jgi:hypothetical protein
MEQVIDAHVVAGITLVGMTFDLVGAFLLVFDLLAEGKDKHFYTLTELLLYGVIGMFVGFVCSATLFTLAVRFHLRILATLGYLTTFGVALGYGIGSGLGFACGYVLHQPRLSHPLTPWFRILSGIGMGLGVGLGHWLGGILLVGVKLAHDFPSGLLTGGISTLLAASAFGFGVRHLFVCKTHRFDALGLLVGLVTVLTGGVLTGVTYELIFGADLLLLLLLGGLVGILGGLTLGLIISLTPLLERGGYSPKQMGVIGTILLFLGFFLQAIPYVAKLFVV